MTPPWGNKKAFTLVEIIVAMSIFLIIITIVLGLFVNVIHQQTKANIERTLAQEVRAATEIIVREGRLAQGDPPLRVGVDEEGGEQEEVEDVGISDANSLEINKDGKVSKIYSLKEGTLYVEENGVNSPLTSPLIEISPLDGKEGIFTLYGVWGEPIQLSVQIQLQARPRKASRAYQDANIILKTTFSSRFYESTP